MNARISTKKLTKETIPKQTKNLTKWKVNSLFLIDWIQLFRKYNNLFNFKCEDIDVPKVFLETFLKQ